MGELALVGFHLGGRWAYLSQSSSWEWQIMISFMGESASPCAVGMGTCLSSPVHLVRPDTQYWIAVYAILI